MPILVSPGYEFAAVAAHLLDVLPSNARIEVEIGAWSTPLGSGSVAWLVVQPLAAEADRAMRAKGVAEVRQALLASGHLRSRLDVVVGDRRSTLDADGNGALAAGSMSIADGAISHDGGMCEAVNGYSAADAALRSMLHGLRLA